MTPPDSGTICLNPWLHGHSAVNPCRCGNKPDSGEREVDRLNRIAVQQCVEEQRKLAKMSPAERARYINDWAARLGSRLADAGTTHDREINAPRVSLPLSLAQRILAALELQPLSLGSLAAELRERLPKPPKEPK